MCSRQEFVQYLISLPYQISQLWNGDKHGVAHKQLDVIEAALIAYNAGEDMGVRDVSPFYWFQHVHLKT